MCGLILPSLKMWVEGVPFINTKIADWCNSLFISILYLIATTYQKLLYKSNLFLKFLVLRESSSYIPSFVVHPVIAISKLLIKEISRVNKSYCKIATDLGIRKAATIPKP